jgi:5-methylcytosine-specific restriction endonuclease McrA
VFKFKLELVHAAELRYDREIEDLASNRMIPTSVKLAVWKRDKGQCVKCGRRDNLHFDHDIPYSKGGSSLVADNIQLLCARHNLAKRDKIE